MKSIIAISILTMFVMFFADAQITSAASGAWGSTTTWVGGIVPTGTDDVILLHNVTLTSPATGACNNITINSGGRIPATVGLLTINGNIDFNGGEIISNSASNYANCVAGKTLTVRNNASVTLAFSSLTAPYVNVFENNFRGIASADMTFDNTFTYTHRTSSTSASGAPLPSLPNGQEYGNIILSSSSSGVRVIALAGDIKLAGNLSIVGASSNSLTLNMSTFQFDCSGSGKSVSLPAGQVGPIGINAAHAEPFKGFNSIDLMTNSGSFLSTITLNGSSAQQLSSTATSVALKNITINNAAGVTLAQDVTVNGALTLTSGDISTGSNTITLASTATVSETSGNTVIGNMTTTRTVTQSVNNTFGGLGIEINATGASPGTTSITRITGIAPTGGGNEGVKRYFDIVPTVNTGLDATLLFRYDESELNGIPEVNLVLFKSTDSGTTWTLSGGTVNTVSNDITLAGIGSFSRWTAANSSAPLPVELVSFSVSSKHHTAQLKWTTASEINNHGFEVERRTFDNGKMTIDNWSKAGFVSGSGNSNSEKSYTFVDANLSAGKYEYRLKQIDNDGAFKYVGSVESVEIGVAAIVFGLSDNYPNPFNPTTSIEFTVAKDGIAMLKVYNLIGQEVATLFSGSAQAGTINRVEFNAKNLPSGMYFSRLQFGGQQMVKRMLLMK